MRIFPSFIAYSMLIFSFLLPPVISMWMRPSKDSAAEAAVRLTRTNAAANRPRRKTEEWEFMRGWGGRKWRRARPSIGRVAGGDQGLLPMRGRVKPAVDSVPRV